VQSLPLVTSAAAYATTTGGASFFFTHKTPHPYTIANESKFLSNCADERCQVGAIESGDAPYRVIPERCIGCGLCTSTCPTGAIRLHHKPPEARTVPPLTEDQWFELRGKSRGVDFSAYK
jgi:NAD-dependent dihydropyrimidine dehydrogenase PreA subunit